MYHAMCLINQTNCKNVKCHEFNSWYLKSHEMLAVHQKIKSRFVVLVAKSV